jgi:PAS domain S-box-containing protein
MVLIAIKDVTEAVEAKQVIEESEATTRALLETAAQGILAIDGSGIIRIANLMAQTMFGYSRDELLGRPLEMLLPEQLRKAHIGHRAGFFSAPRARPMGQGLNLLGLRKDGGEFPVEVSLSHLETKNRRLAVCFVSDIGERKQNEEAALLYQQALQGLTARLISVQETGRKYLARELHDVFSQQLAVLGMEISAIEKRPPESPEELIDRLHRIAERIGSLAKEIHHISRRLHPAILDDLGLAAALNNECLAFSEQYGIPVEFTARSVEGPIPEDISLCLYRVAQESLRNIGKHAGAVEVFVELTFRGGEIVLTVEDVGDGFELEIGRGKGGLGLVSMDERVRLVNGTFSIRSEPGKGTRVEARVPLPEGERLEGDPRPIG